MNCLRRLQIISIIFICIFPVDAYVQNVSVTEHLKAIKTYPFSDPNPLPAMAINNVASRFYPYFMLDGYSDQGFEKDWKVVTLKNDYVTVAVLPEVGGKVWGAIEKSTGREFVYQNHVMKFRAIGIRGPWTSGGIEHNFGLDLGHAPWTASPVDYILLTNPDSSVSCVVGGIDLASRSEWRVKINLPKDKACFETQSMWFNPTPLHDAYLSWENAGFKASDDLQFCFPGSYYIGHDGLVSPWPINKEGRDLSLYKENNFGPSKSYHVSGSYTDWFGGYWKNAAFGFGHWAPYSDAPGKKIWIWSLAREGAIWEDLLTDNDGQYIEAQSGVKFNQASLESGFNSPFRQLSLKPLYTETKTDCWFPVVKTGGMVDASPYGSLNVAHSNDSLLISMSPICNIHDTLKVYLDGKQIYQDLLALKPLQIFKKSILLPENKKPDIKVVVGRNILKYNSDSQQNKTIRPYLSAKDMDPDSPEHLFKMAQEFNAMRDYDQAFAYCRACIKKQPYHAGALTQMAELYYRRADYSKGLDAACKVLENDTYDAAANFISGVIYRRLGKLLEAEELFDVAARTMEYRSGAYLQIAGIRLQNQDYAHAVVYAKKSLDFNRKNLSAYQLLATSYRKLKNYGEASKVLNELLEIDPLNHYARFEQYLLTPNPESLAGFKFYIRNELPYETYLELALNFVAQGQDTEAIQVLEQSPAYPTVYYWLAYLYRNSSVQKSRQFLKQADESSSNLVFPFRLETIPVLIWAQQQTLSWKSNYYLGLIYWHINQIEKARELFIKCADIPDFAPFYTTRGILFQNDKSRFIKVENDFRKACELDPADWRTWYYRSQFYEGMGAFDKQLETTSETYPLFPKNSIVGLAHAKALLNTGNFQECLKVLARVKILPQEGAKEGHDIYELANLSVSTQLMEQKKYKDALHYIEQSKAWPENLGAGMPYNPDTRVQDYLSAFCYAKLGDKKEADNCLGQIISYSQKQWDNDSDPTVIEIANRLFNDSNKKNEAAQYMEKWKTKQDSLSKWKILPGSSSLKAQWVLAKYQKEDEKSELLEQEIAAQPSEIRFRLLMKTLAIINSNKKE